MTHLLLVAAVAIGAVLAAGVAREPEDEGRRYRW
jgi:hypothetical protein